ncbi:endoplasmic reticulum-based factor for assembly of V-ATPase-domain-containing protein [Scheffersomyces xylosifermentans]|uniref:endoplasmic reticulum-based factor for assembly of V-ATPase-domain-containing protein n=1 Tax=Scheffersomyces xylosifermentans TaxID=1304137 RepID=UPI00315CB4B2
MTQYKITPQLESILKASTLNQDTKDRVLAKKYISHTDLINFYKIHKPTATFIDLVKLTSMHIPNKNEKLEDYPKSKHFIKSMEKLRLQEKEKEYRRLVNPNPEYSTLYEESYEDVPITPAQAHKELKAQMTTIVNILISVASVVYAIWYWTASSWGLQDSYRILLCIFFGLLVLVAEVVVYMGYLNKVEQARITERKKKEVKKVVRQLS